MIDEEASTSEYIYCHGGEHRSKWDEWFKYIYMFQGRAFADWANAVILCDDSFDTKSAIYC